MELRCRLYTPACLNPRQKFAVSVSGATCAPLHTMETVALCKALRAVEVCVHSFVRSEMDEDDWSALSLVCLIPETLRYPFSRRMGEPRTILNVLK